MFGLKLLLSFKVFTFLHFCRSFHFFVVWCHAQVNIPIFKIFYANKLHVRISLDRINSCNLAPKDSFWNTAYIGLVYVLQGYNASYFSGEIKLYAFMSSTNVSLLSMQSHFYSVYYFIYFCINSYQHCIAFFERKDARCQYYCASNTRQAYCRLFLKYSGMCTHTASFLCFYFKREILMLN